jgi:hypothetical protein
MTLLLIIIHHSKLSMCTGACKILFKQWIAIRYVGFETRYWSRDRSRPLYGGIGLGLDRPGVGLGLEPGGLG